MEVPDHIQTILAIVASVSTMTLAWWVALKRHAKQESEKRLHEHRAELEDRRLAREHEAREREHLLDGFRREVDRLGTEVRELRRELLDVHKEIITCERDKIFLLGKVNHLLVALGERPVSMDELSAAGRWPRRKKEDTPNADDTDSNG